MPEQLPVDYPAEWETHAVLADGATVELRPIKPTDRDGLDAFHQRQSPTSIYYRFFQHRPKLSAKELEHFTTLDYAERMAFVALLGNEIVAVARYEAMPGGGDPELAFLVDDGHHGRGLATLMLEYLAAAARARGVDGFVATVLPENHGMLRVFRQAGFGVSTRFADGLIDVELDISLYPETTGIIADRESQARHTSVARLLRPSSVAVVGASRREGALGHELLKQLLTGGFSGELFCVNPAADEILGVKSWPSLSAIGAKVDLAVVAVPASAVESVVVDAAEAQVSGLLVMSSGFAERGPEGNEREVRLVELARDYGMRIIGPNAFGMVNTAEDVGLRALFLPLELLPGAVGVVSQSGPLGSAVLDHLTKTGVGISSFVAVGNRADLSVNDLLEYWRFDPETKAVLLYVENFGNLRKFARTARDVAATKPIVTVRPADDHVKELLTQSGVITVDGVAELADAARLIADQPTLQGGRVAIVANAASVARLAVAACTRHGLDVVAPASIEQPLTPPRAGGAVLVEDVDAISLAGGHQAPDYEEILVAAAVSDEVDALMIAMVPNFELSFERLREVIDRVNRSIAKPVVAVGLVGGDAISVPGVPMFTFPEDAARTLGAVAANAAWRSSAESMPAPEPAAAEVSARRERLTDLLGTAQELVVTLWSPEAREVVDILAVPVPSWSVGAGLDELVSEAEQLGYPVVLKARGAANRAVGEAGGVAIDLHDPGQLEAAFHRMEALPSVDLLPAVVQRMVPSVGNVKVEVIQDPALGAFVSVGHGGAMAGKTTPSALHFLPLPVSAAAEMTARLQSRLTVDPAARVAIADTIDRLAALAQAAPELARVTINPLLVAGTASAAGDLEVVIRPWKHDPLSEVRRL